MFSKFRKYAVASAVAIAPLATLLTPGLAHAATGTYYKWSGASSSTAGLNSCVLNCWSVPGNWSVSTDGGTTYVSATTAPQSADNSGSGDNLVFDNAALSADATLTDDISNLKIGNVATVGTATTHKYTIAGQALTITGGAAASVGSSVYVNNAVTFIGDQSFGTDPTNYNAALSVNSSAVTVASGTLTANAGFYPTSLTVASGATIKIAHGGGANTTSGAGSIVITSPVANSPYPNGYNAYDVNTASTFSGSFDVQNGAQLNISGNNPANALGTASLTIEDGGQLNIEVEPTTPTETGTLTIPNAITMGGNGAGVDQMSQGAIIAGLYDSAKNETAGTLAVNLSGNVTLTSDTKLASTYATAVTYNMTGTYNQNGHVLGAVTSVQPTYGVSTVQVNGQTVAGGANNVTPTTPAAPGTPNTGFALAAAKPLQTLVMTLIGTAVIAGIAVKTRKNLARR